MSSRENFRWGVFKDNCLVGVWSLEDDAKRDANLIGGDVQGIRFAAATAAHVAERRAVESSIRADIEAAKKGGAS